VATSTLGFALLGLLARKPRTGYDLTQAMRQPIGYFWSASHSQVYPELAKLEAAGYVNHSVIDGPGPRDTKRYAITAAGRHILAEWAAKPAAPAIARDEFLLKIYSLWLVEPARARELIRAQRAAHQAQLEHYEQIAREVESEQIDRLHDPTTPEFSSYATLRRGMSFERHARDWCAWLLEALAADPTPARSADAPR
jgi:DNA-binding PadR family transcriptional regulator